MTAARSPQFGPDQLEALARQMAATIQWRGEAESLAAKHPGVASADRLRLVARWAELRGIELEPKHAASASPDAEPPSADPPAGSPTVLPEIELKISVKAAQKLKPSALLVLYTLRALANGGTRVTVEIAKLVELTGLSRSTVKRALAGPLATAKFVRTKHNDGKVSTYIISIPRSDDNRQYIPVQAAKLNELREARVSHRKVGLFLQMYVALRAATYKTATRQMTVAEIAAKAGMGLRRARAALCLLQEWKLLKVKPPEREYEAHLYTPQGLDALVIPDLSTPTGG